MFAKELNARMLIRLVDLLNVPWCKKNVNLYAANTAVSEIFPFHKLSDIPVNSHKVLSSDNLSLEWDHFPMFEINRKIGSILNPRRSASGTLHIKSFVPQKDLKLNISISNVMAFSSEEYQFCSHRLADENMSKCRPEGGIISHQDKHMGLNIDCAGEKLKGHMSIEESRCCSKNETNSPCSLTDKLCANNLTVNSKFSASSKENENAEGTLLETKLGALGGCPKQQDFERVSHGPVLGIECEMQPVNASTTSKGTDVVTSGRGMVFANLLQSEHDNLHTHTVNFAMKLIESSDLPGKIENTLATKSEVDTLALGKPPIDLMKDGKRKAPSLFEMLTLPSKSQGTLNDPISSGRPCGKRGSCSLEAQKQFTTKTDTLYSATHHGSGFASTSSHKNSGCPTTAKSEQIATSSMGGVSSCAGGNETLNGSAGNHRSFLKETCTNGQEWSRSKTSSMNRDLVLFQISRMRNPISSALIEPPVCSEPSDRWLKRLQHDILDPHLPCSKKSKIGDGPPPGGARTIFGQELNFDVRKPDMINQPKEVQLIGRLINQQHIPGSLISAKSLNRWVGRWCQGVPAISHGTSNVEKQIPKFNMPSDDVECHFSSIAAMAMVGRAMNKLQPCEFQKRGP